MRKLLILLLVVLSGCLRTDELNRPFRGFAPQHIDDGHLLSSPSLEGVDSLGLIDIYRKAYNNQDLWSLRSMLVFRHGKLISESYFKDPDDISQPHLIWSCTKQVIGVLAGIAIDQGVISSLDDPIENYLSEEVAKHPDKAGITIRDLLTMQSGIDYENDGAKGETHQVLQKNPKNLINYVLSLKQPYDAGTHFYYKDGDPQLVSAIIQKATGKPTDEWADEVLFSKIAFSNYNWVRYPDGTTFGGFGIETTPRDLAKIALLVADSGRWEGQQIVSKQWIADMTSNQVETGYDDYDFGYFWWIDKKEAIHFMWGHAGQFAFIVSEKQLVVVFTSFTNTQSDYQIFADEALPVVYEIMDISN